MRELLSIFLICVQPNITTPPTPICIFFVLAADFLNHCKTRLYLTPYISYGSLGLLQDGNGWQKVSPFCRNCYRLEKVISQ